MEATTNPLHHDIFISYAHVDDTPLMEEEAGWISIFHKTLDALIKQIAGDELDIWRDPKLQGNDYFSDTLVNALPKTSVLVSVLSPRYVKSEWCLKELETFTQAAEASDGVRAGDKSRIFKVLKTFVPRESHPPPLDHLLGYEFFAMDAETGKPQEFRIEFGAEAKQNYLAKLYDLAYEITELLNSIKAAEAVEGAGEGTSDGPRQDASTSASHATVYLAETTSDLSEQRDLVKAELRQLGHTVLPEQALPLDSKNLAEAVSADLKRSKLAIHFVGSNYGFIPEGDRRSVVRLQNDLAAAQSQAQGLDRLVWIPPGTSPTDAKQQQLIDKLQNDSSSQYGADFLNTGIEELKTTIRDHLKAKPEAAVQVQPEDDFVRAYLICDQRDVEAAKPLADYLYSQGFEVMLPVFEGDEAQVREDHTDKLVYSDAILIYYGAANELWLSSKLRDLRKLPGFDGYKPKFSTAIYAAGPVSAAKEHLKSREAMVLKNFDVFTPDSIQAFLNAIKTARAGVAS